MKKTSLFEGSVFISRKLRGLAAAACAATVLVFILPLMARAADEPAAAKVDGQISVILEGWIDGEDAFVFRDGKVFLQHKSFKEPYEITVNGKQWTDLSKPFELGFTPDPAKTQFTCEGRGTSKLTRASDIVSVTIYDHQGAATRYRIILFQPSGVKNPLALPKDPIEKTVMELPTSSRSASQTLGQTGEPAASKVDGQISVILEGWIDGEDAFVFRDGKVFLRHKSFKVPYKITVNGKPWADLAKPFELGFAPDPAKTQFTCEGRGTSGLTRTDDSVTVSIYDHQGAATRYRIILFQPSGVKNPLALPKDPIEKTVMEIPTGSQLVSQAVPQQKKPAAKQQTAATPESGVMVLEGTFEGRGVFLFVDNLIAYSHKEGKYPTDVKVNGKQWTDLKQPLTLDDAAIPARIIRKEARGTVTLQPAKDFARLEINDHQDASASYRIEFGTK